MVTANDIQKRTWPAGPFYILIGDSSLFMALTAEPLDNRSRVKFAPLVPNANQLWVAVELPTSSDGPASAILLNVGGQAPAGYWDYDGKNTAKLEILPNSTAYTKQLWKLDKGLILTAGYSGGEAGYMTVDFDNFQILIRSNKLAPAVPCTFLLEQGSYSQVAQQSNYKYFPNPTQIQGFVGGDSKNVLVDNSKSTAAYTGQVELSFTTETSTTFSQSSSHTDTTSKSITSSLSAGGTFAKVLKIDASVSVTYTTETSDTVTMSTDKTQSQSKTYSITCATSVPKGKKYQFSVQPETKAFQSPYSIPIQINSSIPGAAPYAALLTGTYFGANATASQIIVTDVTDDDPTKHIEVSRTSLPLHRGIMQT